MSADKKKNKQSLWIRILALLCLLTTCFIVCCQLIYEPTGSMSPTIPEQSLVILKRSAWIKKYARGDVVSFHPDWSEHAFTKRIIGLPGEVVDIRYGAVYINGDLLEEPWLCSEDQFSGTYFVPDGCYLMLGDNRAESADSRYWDNPYVSEKEIDGRIFLILYPSIRKVE